MLASACADDVTQSTTVGDTSSTSEGEDPTTGPSGLDSTTGHDDIDGDGSTSDASTSEGPSSGEPTGSGGPRCGDGVIEGDEVCDGDALDEQTCEGLGFDGGTLTCDDACELNTRGCTSASCGNDAVEGAELCDGTDLDAQDCVSQGFDDGTLACDPGCGAFDVQGCVDYVCGNDVMEPGEACDGLDFNGETCASAGFGSGVLTCAAGCTIVDNGSCFDVPACAEEDIGGASGAAVTTGNTTGEDEDLAQTCGGGVDHVVSWFAPWPGTWVFDTFGSSYDTVLSAHSACGPGTSLACNDDSGGLQSQITLVLDAGDSVLLAISGFGNNTGAWVLNITAPPAPIPGGCCFASGAPGCDDVACETEVCATDPECCAMGWTDACALAAQQACDVCDEPDVCGNTVLEAGEVCDTDDFGGETCEGLGFAGGSLECLACTTIDPSGCTVAAPCCAPHDDPGCFDADCTDLICAEEPFCCDFAWLDFCSTQAQAMCAVCNTPDICGNGTLDAGEACDAPDLGGQTCPSEGFDGGTLGCAFDCSALDTSGCFDFGGDCCAAHVAPGCDDPTCSGQVCGFDPFCCDLQWDAFCAQNANDMCAVCGVPAGCGNSLIEGTEVCDNMALAGATCETLGFGGGFLECLNDCTDFDTSGCLVFGGDCCSAHAGLGCDNAACADAVCAQDGFCCDVQWDILCADEAAQLCPVCGAPGCGNGVLEAGEACDGPALDGETCASQGFDTGPLACAADCDDFDTSGCFAFDGDCCAPDATPGCQNAACSDLVCASDADCCATAWDAACADAAVLACAVCTAGTCGNNVIELGEACDGTDLDEETCVAQGFDAGTIACAADCSAFATAACVTFSGDCCDPAGDATPGCDDDVCTASVCEDDPSCCTGPWDAQCAAIANATCGVCGAFFDFSGVLTDVPEDDLVGWQECYVDTYATGGVPIDDVLAACDEDNLLMACRHTGDDVLLVAANAPRDDVTFPTGTGNIPHVANGVGWYFDGSWSWGFAPQGAAIFRDSCDIMGSTFMPGPFGDQRLCFQTFQDALAIGWRCGTNQDLNFSTAFERVFFQRP